MSREMALWLSTLIKKTLHQFSVLTTICNATSRASGIAFRVPGTRHASGAHTYIQAKHTQFFY